MNDEQKIPGALTVNEVIDALAAARGGLDRPGAEAFLDGYDFAISQARFLSDYPWTHPEREAES